MSVSKRYSLVPAGTGQDHDWSADHTYVKVSASDTGGQYTLMEDNLKENFRLGLHLHRYHAETFYILEGSVDFYVDGDWATAEPGTCLHVPPGIEHACLLSDGCSAARMLMIYQPSGFDQYLQELAQMSEADFEDTAKMAELEAKYDIINIGPVPDRATMGAQK
jgi:quercetin dioxygenase-like cupin family protein